MKNLKFILVLFFAVGANANYAPADIYAFFENTIEAKCAYTTIKECDHADCWGEKEAFFFGLKENGNPLAHSFKNLSEFGENFETTYEILRNGEVETLKMSLFKKAWAPTFPDRPGRYIGVTKFSYVITKDIIENKIVYAEETEFIRRKTILGSLNKTWKQNAVTKICQDN